MALANARYVIISFFCTQICIINIVEIEKDPVSVETGVSCLHLTLPGVGKHMLGLQRENWHSHCGPI